MWALATLGAAILTASYVLQPTAPVGTEDDAGPELDVSVTLPLLVKGVETCSNLVQEADPDAGGPRPTAPVGTDPLKPGVRLPNLELPCLTAGSSVDVARLSGRPTVVNLWASWCTPCREEMPVLQQTQTREQGAVQFLGVNTKDRPDWAADFLREVEVRYPEVVDRSGRLLTAVRSPGLPVTIVLDREGRLSGQQVGRVSQQRLDELLAEAGA